MMYIWVPKLKSTFLSVKVNAKIRYVRQYFHIYYKNRQRNGLGVEVPVLPLP